MTSLTRRNWLQRTGMVGFGLLAGMPSSSAQAAETAPVRTITRGPKHHWFGYYDKHEFDPTNRFVLSMEVDFEHRSPRPDDVIKIGMVDLADGDRWIELGESSAWGWQQGCMLQWVPGSKSEILWNDREGDRFVCHILDTKTRKKRTAGQAIYTVSPDGRTAMTADFRRINDVRPGYGYVGLPDPHADDLAPKDSGVWRVDLTTGKSELIMSLWDISRFGEIPYKHPGIKHYFNHLLFSPDGSRFIVLHRWQYPTGGWYTRMITAAPDGSDVRIVDKNGITSHFIWRDPKRILAWSRQKSHDQRFYMFEDGTDKIEVVAPDVFKRDGHCSYLPGGEWILNDTYPDQDRLQHVYLYNVKSGRNIEIGAFHLPNVYKGEWRCDTHPRSSRDGQMVVVDAPLEDQGRQLHLMDVSKFVG